MRLVCQGSHCDVGILYYRNAVQSTLVNYIAKIFLILLSCYKKWVFTGREEAKNRTIVKKLLLRIKVIDFIQVTDSKGNYNATRGGISRASQ